MAKATVTKNPQTEVEYQMFLDEPIGYKEAAAYLKRKVRTLQYLVGTDQIYFSRVGKRGVTFTRRRLQEWLRDNEGVEYRLQRGEG